jgi:hypothetical protein
LERCAHSTSFNISATAGYYSVAAGVMAGFAFISLSYLITASHQAGNDRSDLQRDRYNLATQALGAAFVALLLSCVEYAIMAGEPLSGGRASTIEVFAGSSFALAAIQLVYAIVLMIRTHHHESLPIERFFQRVGGFLCWLGYLLIQIGVTDYQEARDDYAGNIIFQWGWSLLLIMSLTFAAAWWARGRIRLAMPALMNPAYWTMGIGAAAITATSILAAVLEPCETAAPLVMVLVLALTCGALANQILWFFQPPSVFIQATLPRSSHRSIHMRREHATTQAIGDRPPTPPTTPLVRPAQHARSLGGLRPADDTAGLLDS